MSRDAVTRADVARLAGVSPAVVSYVVNGSPRPVSSHARSRVEEAIRQLGYRPNAVARALRMGMTRTVGLVVPNVGNPFFADLSRRVQHLCADAGYSLLLVDSEGDAEREAGQIMNLIDRQIDGLIVASGSAHGVREDLMRSIGVPCVVLDRVRPVPGVVTVGVDFESASALAVRHLLQHGHDRIAAILGDDGSDSTRARERGWAAAIRSFGAVEGRTIRAPYTRDGGYRAGLSLLRRVDRPSAVFVSSDLQAVGLLRAAHAVGVRVPDDLAVVAFDGSAECAYTSPPLSVVEQPVDAIAEAAVRAITEAAPGADHTVFRGSLRVRGSCGCVSAEPEET